MGRRLHFPVAFPEPFVVSFVCRMVQMTVEAVKTDLRVSALSCSRPAFRFIETCDAEGWIDYQVQNAAVERFQFKHVSAVASRLHPVRLAPHRRDELEVGEGSVYA